jgi:hypothetical protein
MPWVNRRKHRAFLKKVWLSGYRAGRVQYHLYGPGAGIDEDVQEYLKFDNDLSW